MSIASQSVATQRTMRLLGRSYMAFVFAREGPIIEWLGQLDSWLARSPGFFADRPVVLDLTNLKLHKRGLSHLMSCLLERNIRVIGLEGADPAHLGPDLPPLLSGRPVNAHEVLALSRAEQPPRPAPQTPAALFI